MIVSVDKKKIYVHVIITVIIIMENKRYSNLRAINNISSIQVIN